MAMVDEGIVAQIPAPPSGAEEFIESSYTPFKLMSWHLYQMRTEYENLLRQSNYYTNQFRKRIVDSANILYRESKQTGFGIRECERLEEILNKMQRLDNEITTIIRGLQFQSTTDIGSKAILDEYIEKFQRTSYQFLTEENTALQNHGQLYKTRRRIEQIEKLEKVFVINKHNFFFNKFGIPISLEMWIMAKIMTIRVENKLDNFFPIEGPTGWGKTSFAWGLGSTVAELQGQAEFSPKNNFLFNEDTKYTEERFRLAEHKSILVPDEFGNQANKRRFYEDGQINFMDRIKLLRFHGLTILPCWPSVKELDSQLETKIHGIFDITERGSSIHNPGTAQLRTFNLNKYAKKEFTPWVAKDMIAFDAESANKIIEDYDEFNMMTIPFYEVPSQIWYRDYEPFKEGANQTGRAAAGQANLRKLTEAFQYEFLAKLPDDCVRITSVQLKAFSREKNFYMDFGGLAKRIANGVGMSRSKIFHIDPNAKERWDGYIEVDDYIKKYIDQKKAQFRGAKEAAKS